MAGLTLNFVTAKAQDAIYNSIIGVEPLFQMSGAGSSESSNLTVTLQIRYDDILRSNGADGRTELARSTATATVDWRLSHKQSWQFEILREKETLYTNRTDSSLSFDNLQTRNRFRISYRRTFDKAPIHLHAFLQAYLGQGRLHHNYGFGIAGKVKHFIFSLDSEYTSWFPFFQEILTNNHYQVEIRFPTLANLRQFKWSVAGTVGSFTFRAGIGLGTLKSTPRSEREFTFHPSAKLELVEALLQKPLTQRWQLRFAFHFNRYRGDGTLRFRDRKYGNLHVQQFHFWEIQGALRQTRNWNVEMGAAYQTLSGQGSAGIEAWPFDHSGIDFFRAKQSLAGDGRLQLLRAWVRAPFRLSKKLRLFSDAEAVRLDTQTTLRTWGTAFIFGTGQLEQYDFVKKIYFARLRIRAELNLSKSLALHFRLSQWIPVVVEPQAEKTTSQASQMKGGTFGQIAVRMHL
ncbi:MAG: hypothetical protein ACE5IR_14410 [bacterium]